MVVLVSQAQAELYKYKDENGVWRFTDNPLSVPEVYEEIGGAEKGNSGPDLAARLMEKYKPKNNLSATALSSVSIKSGFGTGRGFFISSNGHIITSKWLIRGDERLSKSHGRETPESTYASLQNAFVVTLIDKSEVTADLIGISDTYGLALLKISSFSNTPCIPIIAAGKRMPLGDPVYIATSWHLGTPSNDGVISGYDDTFVRTDARVGLRNNGCPLVNKYGEVIGVTFFNNLTNNYAGLGFALQIELVLKEFDTVEPWTVELVSGK